MKRKVFFKGEIPGRNNGYNEADVVRLPCLGTRNILRSFSFLYNEITVCDEYSGLLVTTWVFQYFMNLILEIHRAIAFVIEFQLTQDMKTDVTTATHEKLMALRQITVNDSLILRDCFEWTSFCSSPTLSQHCSTNSQQQSEEPLHDRRLVSPVRGSRLIRDILHNWQ